MGDYDYDGVFDLAVYRESTATWYIQTVARRGNRPERPAAMVDAALRRLRWRRLLGSAIYERATANWQVLADARRNFRKTRDAGYLPVGWNNYVHQPMIALPSAGVLQMILTVPGVVIITSILFNAAAQSGCHDAGEKRFARAPEDFDEQRGLPLPLFDANAARRLSGGGFPAACRALARRPGGCASTAAAGAPV